MSVSSKKVLLLSVWTLFNLATCTVDENKVKLVRKLRRFQKIDAVFVNKNPSGESEIDKMDVDELKSDLKKQYKNVRCSFLFVYLTYLNTVRRFWSLSIQVGDFKQLVSNDSLDSFVTESSRMLATSVHTAQLSSVKRLMWILHVYAQWLVDKFINAKTVRNRYVSDEVIMPAHRALCELLKRALYLQGCSECLNKDLVNLESMTTIPAIPYEYKQMLSSQLNEYEQAGLMSSAGWKSCGLQQLCLNDVVSDSKVIEDLQENFGMMKPRVVLNRALETSFYAVCPQRTLHLADTIDELCKLQHNFVQMSKAIMVRIIWCYVQYSEENSDADCRRSHNEEILNILIDFTEFFYLYNDEHMNRLIGVFLEQLKPQNDLENIFEKRMDDLLLILDDIAKSFIPNLLVSFTEKIPMDGQSERRKIIEIIASSNELNIDEHTKTMPDSVYRARVFLEYIKLKLHDIDFNITKDFCTINSSKVHQQLRELENCQSQP